MSINKNEKYLYLVKFKDGTIKVIINDYSLRKYSTVFIDKIKYFVINEPINNYIIYVVKHPLV